MLNVFRVSTTLPRKLEELGVSPALVLRQAGYKPVWEDWLWYATLPCSAYAALAIAALFLSTVTRLALFTIGAAALALLFSETHNAWDAVTHIVVTGTEVSDE